MAATRHTTDFPLDSMENKTGVRQKNLLRTVKLAICESSRMRYRRIIWLSSRAYHPSKNTIILLRPDGHLAWRSSRPGFSFNALPFTKASSLMPPRAAGKKTRTRNLLFFAIPANNRGARLDIGIPRLSATPLCHPLRDRKVARS